MKSALNKSIIPVAMIICLMIIANPSSYGQAGRKSVKKQTAAPEVNVTRDGKVTCLFDNVDIRVVIKYFSDLTGQNFIIDNDVRGTISVIAPTAFPIEDAIGLLGSILEMQGYTLVQSGDFIKVVSKNSASRKNIPVIKSGGDKNIADDDKYSTKVIPLSNVRAEKIQESLRKLYGRDYSIIAFPETNSLILTAKNSNFANLEELIQELDKPAVMINDIRGLILRYSQLTGKNILIGEIGKNRVKIFNPNGFSDEDLLNSMETIISTAGLIMEERGDLIVIEPDPAKSEAMITADPGGPGRDLNIPSPKHTGYESPDPPNASGPRG